MEELKKLSQPQNAHSLVCHRHHFVSPQYICGVHRVCVHGCTETAAGFPCFLHIVCIRSAADTRKYLWIFLSLLHTKHISYNYSITCTCPVTINATNLHTHTPIYIIYQIQPNPHADTILMHMYIIAWVMVCLHGIIYMPFLPTYAAKFNINYFMYNNAVIL